MIAKLLNRKLMFKLNNNLFSLKECKTYLSFKLFKRSFSENSDIEKERPELMSFKPKFFPNFWYQWKNIVTIHLIIRPFLDNHFSINKFMIGSKQALVYISNCLADGKVDQLNGLVTDEAINEIRGNLSLLNVKQLEELRFQLEDIVYSFPYRIGIIMNDNDNKRFVEITVVFYCIYKYQMLKERPELTFQQFKSNIANQVTVCNYRFIRDYTEGVESDWTVNQVGHFKNQDK